MLDCPVVKASPGAHPHGACHTLFAPLLLVNVLLQLVQLLLQTALQAPGLLPRLPFLLGTVTEVSGPRLLRALLPVLLPQRGVELAVGAEAGGAGRAHGAI
jgi:hypothetical protein